MAKWLVRLLTVPFRVHGTGWVLLAFCVLIGFELSGWQMGFAVGSLLVASLLLHEVGHMFAASWLGVPVHEFGLRMGGAYNRRAYAGCRRDEVLISVAGPLTNLLLTIPLLALPLVGAPLALCNLVLGLGNLLPIPSSDGLRILRTLCSANVVA